MNSAAPHASGGDHEGERPLDDAGATESAELGRLRRWERSGAIWQVLRRRPDGVEIALLTCDAGEQVDLVRSADPDLIAWIGHRDRSDDPGPGGDDDLENAGCRERSGVPGPGGDDDLENAGGRERSGVPGPGGHNEPDDDLRET